MLLTGTLRCGLDAIRGLERFDLFGEFGNAWAFLFAGLMTLAGKAGLELVTQAGQFRQAAIKSEGFAEPYQVITKPSLGDGEVLSDSC